jgi:hypothetical protein
MNKENQEKTASFEIDKTTYKVDSKNYNHSKCKKSQIVLAGSLRAGSNHILRLKKKDFGLTKNWPMFTVRRDGKIYQHFEAQYSSEFLGSKEADKKAITVVLENMGHLTYEAENNRYVNWINEECERSKVYEKVFKNYRYWEKFTEEQVTATINLCIYLCRTYGIRQDCVDNWATYEGSSIYNGILTRSNYNSDYSDLNPSFDYKRFLKELSIFE